ncbi:MAG: GNAT family N-acetyltransferase [Desulfuromonadaceae bacterium]|nr:GNAT family N-acetyltransferase [Desulfuromonadaceae bacterium]
MIFDRFCASDIDPFLELATVEGWIAERWEFEFLLRAFAEGCFAAREISGEVVGFVTSIRHDRSGWIGNLLVRPECRGKGIGASLFKKALEGLFCSDVETVWLTASKSGMPLYQKLGFKAVDTINRWTVGGRGRGTAQEISDASSRLYAELNEFDSRAWGDRREALIAATVGRGRVIKQDAGFVVLQKCGECVQFGPFLATDYSSADALLKSALNAVSQGTRVCIDTSALNLTASRLFKRYRMEISGSNELMYAGAKPAYAPEYIYGLATMGSCG